MKKIIVILAITLTGQLVFAQTKEATAANPDKEKMERRAFHKGKKHRKAEMMKQLNLSDEQKSKLEAMKAAGKEKRDAIRNNSSLTEAQKKDQMKALKEEHKKGMESLLTNEQKQKMKEMRSKMKEERKQHRKMKGRGDDASMPKEEAKPSTQN